MIPVHPKTNGLKLQWALILFILAGILSTTSCHTELTEQQTEQNADTKPEKQKLQQKLVEARRKEKALQQENTIARNSDLYLVIDLTNKEAELKAKGRSLRIFKIKRQQIRPGSIPDKVQVMSEVKPMQKVDRPKLEPGGGETATAEAAQKMLWGLHRMPQDYDLLCQDGMIFEFRALPSERTGSGPIRFIKTLYKRILDRYRNARSSDQVPLQAIQLWLDENDSRLLFWSIPKKLKIMVIAAASSTGLQPDSNCLIQSSRFPALSEFVGKTQAALQEPWRRNTTSIPTPTDQT